MDTLDLIANGWKLQRGYQIQPRFQVISDERELGNVTSTAVAEKELRTYPLKYRAELRSAAEYVQSFFRRLVGEAGRFLFLLPELLASPDASPILDAVVAGAQGSRTIFVQFAWKNAQGLTRASPASSIAVPSSSLLEVKLPPYPPSVNQAVIYATQGSAGAEQQQTILTDVRTWQQPDAALLVSTAAPPTVNTATEIIKMRMVSPYSLTRGDGTTYELALELEEAY
jgi:hypothetical protein